MQLFTSHHQQNDNVQSCSIYNNIAENQTWKHTQFTPNKCILTENSDWGTQKMRKKGRRNPSRTFQRRRDRYRGRPLAYICGHRARATTGSHYRPTLQFLHCPPFFWLIGSKKKNNSGRFGRGGLGWEGVQRGVWVTDEMRELVNFFLNIQWFEEGSKRRLSNVLNSS